MGRHRVQCLSLPWKAPGSCSRRVFVLGKWGCLFVGSSAEGLLMPFFLISRVPLSVCTRIGSRAQHVICMCMRIRLLPALCIIIHIYTYMHVYTSVKDLFQQCLWASIAMCPYILSPQSRCRLATATDSRAEIRLCDMFLN